MAETQFSYLDDSELARVTDEVVARHVDMLHDEVVELLTELTQRLEHQNNYVELIDGGDP